MIDIADKICICRVSQDSGYIVPFIFTMETPTLNRRSGMSYAPLLTIRKVPFWLEWSNNLTPSPAEIGKVVTRRPQFQTLNDFNALPIVEHVWKEDSKLSVFGSVTPRYPGGELAVARFYNGCLWTIVPPKGFSL